MPPRRGCHLAMPQEALLHDRDLVAIAPVTTARRIRGREDFNLGSELMVGHKVGLSTDAETPSDGFHRRHTMVELRMSNGRCLRFDSGIDEEALTRLIRAVDAA